MTTNQQRKDWLKGVLSAKQKKTSNRRPWAFNFTARVKNKLRKFYKGGRKVRLSKLAAPYLTGTLMYLIAETFDMARNHMKKVSKRKTINCADLGNAFREDEEFNELLQKVIIPCYPFRTSDSERSSIFNVLSRYKQKQPKQKQKSNLEREREFRNEIENNPRMKALVAENKADSKKFGFKYICDICGMGFNTLAMYKEHLRNRPASCRTMINVLMED